MFGYVVYGGAFGRLDAQATLYEAERARALARHNELTVADLFDEPVVVAALERHRAVDERVEEHAQTPAVDFGAVVGKAVDDLGRRVERTAAKRVQQVVWAPVVAQSKIGQLFLDQNKKRIYLEEKFTSI